MTGLYREANAFGNNSSVFGCRDCFVTHTHTFEDLKLEHLHLNSFHGEG